MLFYGRLHARVNIRIAGRFRLQCTRSMPISISVRVRGVSMSWSACTCHLRLHLNNCAVRVTWGFPEPYQIDCGLSTLWFVNSVS